MAQNGIPAWGNWDSTDNTPYTQKFENVRRTKKTGVSSSPSDPRRSPEPPRKSPLHPSKYTPEALDHSPKYQPHASKPEPDHPRPMASPLREPVPRRHANPLHQQHLDQGGYGSPYRATAGAASPMQAGNAARSKHPSAGMQTPERRASSAVHGPLTPGRIGAKQGGRAYEVDDEVAVPPFGGWDEGNAASGENYTGIFNRVRNDKLSPNSSAKQPSSYSGKQENKVQQTCPCCIL